MGTRLDLVLPGLSPDVGRDLADAAERLVLHLEGRLSRFDPDSVVSRLNALASRQPVSLDEDLWDVLSLCKRYHQSTGGAFDITLRPLFDLWRSRRSPDDFQEPTEEQIDAALAKTGLEHITLDDEHHTVHFARPDLEIDLGGFGKGYALERLRELLVHQRVACAFVSFGESSILALGPHPLGQEWPVGIEHLFQHGSSAYTFRVRDASVSTSGTTPNNNPVGTPKYGHVINPATGYPVAGLRTMSVASASPLEAEVLSTALLLAPPERRETMLMEHAPMRAVEIEYDSEGDFHVSWVHEPVHTSTS